MKLTFFPKTKAGILALGFFGLMLVCLAYFFLMVDVFNQRGGDTFFSNLNLTIPMLLAWASGAVSLVFGAISFVRHKQLSILVLLTTLITFMTTMYGVLEVSFPH